LKGREKSVALHLMRGETGATPRCANRRIVYL
jgi:hypothetical protein